MGRVAVVGKTWRNGRIALGRCGLEEVGVGVRILVHRPKKTKKVCKSYESVRRKVILSGSAHIRLS